MLTIVDETKDKHKLLKDIHQGTIFSFAGEDDLYIKNQDGYITDLKTGTMLNVVERWLSLKVTQYDVKISLINKY